MIKKGLLDKKVKSDDSIRSGVLYYLGVANYKLTFYKQSRRSFSLFIIYFIIK